MHRHFPTKEALVAAVVAARLHRLADRAEARDRDPATDFFDFLSELATEARHNLVLTAALGGPLGPEGDEAATRLSRALESLLQLRMAGCGRLILQCFDLVVLHGHARARDRL